MGDAELLAAFLAARLDEDEAIARLAAREGGTWEQEDPVRFPGTIMSLGGHVTYDEGAPDENQGPHIARHDPARVLREVAAKRAHIRMWETFAVNFTHIDETVFEFAKREALEDVLAEDAAVYSDHPDYRPEWKPE
jgi:hypothetical protein